LQPLDGQTLASQEAELTAAGCAKVYSEKVSGARTDRIELAKVLKRIEAGDMLVVTRLDRLARSTRDLLNILHDLKERGAGFKSLADGLCSAPVVARPSHGSDRFHYFRMAYGRCCHRSRKEQPKWGNHRGSSAAIAGQMSRLAAIPSPDTPSAQPLRAG
jgi:hypothetical protein